MSPTRITLLGKNGQLGFELQRALAAAESPFQVTALGRLEADWGTSAGMAAGMELVRASQPQIIINAAAYTAVDKAESDASLAYAINAALPQALAGFAASTNTCLIHYSTDYVFDGTGQTARLEDAPTKPINVYGQTKLAGEQFIQASSCSHWIFRTSWVYAVRGQNFAKTILKLARERTELSVIADQVGAPTSAAWLAEMTVEAVTRIADNHPLRLAFTMPLPVVKRLGMATHPICASGTKIRAAYPRYTLKH